MIQRARRMAKAVKTGSIKKERAMLVENDFAKLTYRARQLARRVARPKIRNTTTTDTALSRNLTAVRGVCPNTVSNAEGVLAVSIDTSAGCSVSSRLSTKLQPRSDASVEECLIHPVHPGIERPTSAQAQAQILPPISLALLQSQRAITAVPRDHASDPPPALMADPCSDTCTGRTALAPGISMGNKSRVCLRWTLQTKRGQIAQRSTLMHLCTTASALINQRPANQPVGRGTLSHTAHVAGPTSAALHERNTPTSRNRSAPQAETSATAALRLSRHLRQDPTYTYSWMPLVAVSDPCHRLRCARQRPLGMPFS